MSTALEEAMTKLPEGWKTVRLSDIANTSSGGTPSSKNSDYYGGDIPWVKIGDLTDGPVATTEQTITEEGLANSSAKLLPVGTLLVAMYGASIGKQGVLKLPAATNQAICAIRPAAEVSARFLFWYFMSARQRLIDQGRGGAQPNIGQKDIKELKIPLPPRFEQDRIVEAVERLMADITAGEHAISVSLAACLRMRRSLRQAAVTGALFGAKPLDAIPGSELPEDWRWFSLAEVAGPEPRSFTDGPFGSNLKTEHYVSEGPRVLRLENVGEGVFIDKRTHISEERYEQLVAHDARAGDVIIGALGDLLPRACVVPKDVGAAIVKADCPRLRVADRFNPEFIAAALNSALIRAQAEEVVHGVGRQRLNLQELRRLQIPAPARQEQDRIVAALATHIGYVHDVEQTLLRERRQSQQLRTSILQSAFCGSLFGGKSLALANNDRAVPVGEYS